MMAGIKKELGPTARRVAEAIRRIRRGPEQDITTAELSRRLAALGQPIPDTSITKTEQGTRRVDVDDLAAISLALGVTPNTLMLPQVAYLGSLDWHKLTPASGGSAGRLWQWAQGERPLRLQIPGADGWLGGAEYPALEFSIRCRPYLTALRAPGDGTAPGVPSPTLKGLSAAVSKALAEGVAATEVRRVVELTLAMPSLMSREEIRQWLSDGTRPGGEKP